MARPRSMPQPLSILMIVILLAAAATWLIPSGEYSKLSNNNNQSFLLRNGDQETALPLTQHTLDSLHIRIPLQKFTNNDIRKPVSIPGTYAKRPSNRQGAMEVLQAPIKGIYDSIDIILFVLIIGGFMFVFNETGAMNKGIQWIAYNMKGREPLLMVILTSLFSFFGASYGMAEEALVFYPLLVPLFVSAGYDLLVPLGIIFGGTSLGAIAAFSNPFATIIASNASGISWLDGFGERVILWVILTIFFNWYLLRYARRVKKDPAASLVRRYDGEITPPFDSTALDMEAKPQLGIRNVLLLLLYLLSFMTMIAGVVFLKWWTLEMSTLFFGASLLMAWISGMKEKLFVQEFIRGAASLLNVAFIIGVARGVTIILNEGMISDSILYQATFLVQGIPGWFFILMILAFYFFFSLFIQSSSGMAVLTMPIIGALAIVVNIPGREIVNAYNYGLCLMSFLAPTGLILPSLSMVNVSYRTWWKFIMRPLLILILICVAALLLGIHI